MKNRIFGYDVARSLAILLVMLGHVLGYLYSGTFSFFFSFLLGFFGVELFFILSGILIGKILLEIFESTNINLQLRNFIQRRWLRTLPLYFVMLIVYWLGNIFFDPIKNNDVSIWKYFIFLQNFYEIQPTFFGVSWSLSIEEWFYILFPLTLWMIKKGQPKIATKTLFGIAIFTFIAYFLIIRILAFPVNHFTFYEGARKVAFFRLDSIAYGILCAFFFHYFSKQINVNRFILLGLGLLILGVNQYFIFRDNYSNLWFFNTIYFSVLGIGLVCLFPFFKGLKSSKSVVIKSVTFISTISYSLYLVHWLVYKCLELSYFSILPNVLKFVLFFVISSIVATVTYHYIEKPFLKLRSTLK